MASSRFVISTLNGMFIAQLAAWITAPGGAAVLTATPTTPLHPALLSRADDDPARTLDEGWQVVIPVPIQQAETRAAINPRLAPGKDHEEECS